MNALQTLLERFAHAGDRTALITPAARVTYCDLLAQVSYAEAALAANGCEKTSVMLVGDYSAATVGCLLALWRQGNVVALCCAASEAQIQERLRISQSIWLMQVGPDGDMVLSRSGVKIESGLMQDMNLRAEAGFVIFSSGSTGTPKASIHRTSSLLAKHLPTKRCLVSISFLLFDHIGGLNTLLYVLFNQGTLVLPASRSPDVVAQSIQANRVQAMTTSPTFLNLLLISGALLRHDLTSLEVVNYGTEPMPESLLLRLTVTLPGVRFTQAYGLTETGVIPARSTSSSSTWITFDEAQCDVRVVDGLLEVRVPGSMLGYLNAPSPFTQDGYFRTGDAVVRQGNRFRVLGRTSDLINVGGEKVYPAEIENVLRELPGVVEVAVTRIENPIMGHMVGATFRLLEEEELEPFRKRLFEFCRDRLPASHVPRKVRLTHAPLHSDRFKKQGTRATQASFIEEGGNHEH